MAQNTVIRIYKNDNIIKTHTQDREDLAIYQVRYRVYLYKKNEHVWWVKAELDRMKEGRSDKKNNSAHRMGDCNAYCA